MPVATNHPLECIHMATQTTTIDPLAVYTVDQLCAMLDVSETTLLSARRSGALRCTRKGRRVLYLGEWVLTWLRDEAGEEAPHGH
jgi:hypothetical protein